MAWVYLVFFGFFGSILFPRFPDRNGPTFILLYYSTKPEIRSGFVRKIYKLFMLSPAGTVSNHAGESITAFRMSFQETLSGYQGPLVGGAADFPRLRQKRSPGR